MSTGFGQHQLPGRLSRQLLCSIPGNTAVCPLTTRSFGSVFSGWTYIGWTTCTQPASGKIMTIQGIYDVEFTPNPPDTFTTIQGNGTLQNGTLKVQRVKIE